MTATLDVPASLSPGRAQPLLLRRHWLAALAVLVIFFTPYQTLVQTVLTDDAVRKGLDIDEYDMVWQQVGYGVGILYGVFTAIWLSARIGALHHRPGPAGVRPGQSALWGGCGVGEPGCGSVCRWLR